MIFDDYLKSIKEIETLAYKLHVLAKGIEATEMALSGSISSPSVREYIKKENEQWTKDYRNAIVSLKNKLKKYEEFGLPNISIEKIKRKLLKKLYTEDIYA